MRHQSRSQGISQVRYVLDAEAFAYPVKVAEASASEKTDLEMADAKKFYHIASPSKGDLWVMHVSHGDVVKKEEEVFNITVRKLKTKQT